MGAFAHVLSLLSFVYALAIAHLLGTAARLIGARERVRFSWFHAYWMLNALVVLVVDWISYWDMNSVPRWTVVSIFIVLAQSFADFMQAALVCPEIPPEGTIELPAFHASHARRYIGAFAVTCIIALFDNLYFGGGYRIADFLAQNLVVVPLIALAVFATVVRRRWVDIATPILLLCIWGYYLSQLQSALK
ncbi:MAG TPA: hypothetical protein VKR31_08935 [Rhizomicrobium sp.]|nr:hypothetical protein [Rhizomicrobium sp.]